MIWLTWRQHRGQFLFVFGLLAIIAAIVLPTGVSMHSAFVDMGLADCTAALTPSVLSGSGPVDPADIRCAVLADEFLFRHGERALIVAGLLALVPLAFGVVIGTQLVADDADHGTHRLVWTQSVTRNRWYAAKLGIAGAVTALFAFAYGGLGYWYTMPIIKSGGSRIVLSDVLGATPVGYALFALALGAFTGAMWRKVPPAIAATLFGFVAVRLAMRSVRPAFLAPLERKLAVQWDPAQIEIGRPYWLRLNGDWEVGAAEYNADGRVLSDTGMRFCASPSPSPGGDPAVPTGPGVDFRCGNADFPAVDYNVMLYHPDSRFWIFQLVEVAIFLGLTVLLVIVTARRVSRLT